MAIQAHEINATGIRGYLLWLRQQQPGIYAKAAPQIAKLVPDAFSDFGLSGLADDPTLAPISVDTSNITAPDVADAANSGTSDSSSTSLISDIVDGISQLYLTKEQADAMAQINATQLARAQSGQPPLAIATQQNGIPTITASAAGGGLSSSTLLIGAAIGLGALLLVGSRRRA